MANPANPARARILIVDDEPDQVEMYQYALEIAGFHVISAFDGRSGVARAREMMPDLIVLDLRLPDITGWQVCGHLKDDPCTRRIPILILTAAVTSDLAQDSENAGCAAYLMKPCYPDELTATIASILAPS